MYSHIHREASFAITIDKKLHKSDFSYVEQVPDDKAKLLNYVSLFINAQTALSVFVLIEKCSFRNGESIDCM